MNKILIVGVVIVAVLLGASFIFVGAANEAVDGKYTLIASGQVTYGFAGITGWGLSDVSYYSESENMNDLFSFANPLLFWNSGDIYVQGKLFDSSGSKVQEDQYKIGPMGIDTGDSRDYTIEFKHVDPETQPYQLRIFVYETGSGLFSEDNLKVQKTVSNINVE